MNTVPHDGPMTSGARPASCMIFFKIPGIYREPHHKVRQYLSAITLLDRWLKMILLLMGIIKKRSVSCFANKYRGLASDIGVTLPHPCHRTYQWKATRFHSAPNHCTLISNPQWPMPVALWAVATGQIGMNIHFLACQPSSSIRDNKQKNFQAGDATHGYSACKIYLISYFVHFEKYIVRNVGGLRSPSFESTVFCILNLVISLLCSNLGYRSNNNSFKSRVPFV